jgi:hypothetical protein
MRDQRPSRLPMKIPAAPQPRPNPKQRRPALPPPKTHRVAADTEVLPADPETRALHRQHWVHPFRGSNLQRIQDRYNFTLHETRASTFPEMVRSLYRQQTTAFKTNLSFGFILRNIETGVLQYYHPSQNNASSEQKKTWRGFWRSWADMTPWNTSGNSDPIPSGSFICWPTWPST